MFSFNKLVFIALAAFAYAHPHPLVSTSVEDGSTCATDTVVCGPGRPCSNGMCCSQWGYCGTTQDYCGECCQNNCDPNNRNRSGGGNDFSPAPTPSPMISGNCATETAMCGPGRHCDGGMCCSQWGYCGTTADYCGECCQNNCFAQQE